MLINFGFSHYHCRRYHYDNRHDYNCEHFHILVGIHEIRCESPKPPTKKIWLIMNLAKND